MAKRHPQSKRHQALQQARQNLMGMIPDRFLADLLSIPGARAAMTGGATRDAYRNATGQTNGPDPIVVDDLDISVEGVPFAELTSHFRTRGYQADETGASFLVLKVRVDGAPGGVIDVACCRADSKVGDGHRGFAVQGSADGRLISLEDEAGRRDFTSGSILMLVDPSITDEQAWIDPFGGLDDIDARILRAVGDVRIKFDDDPLRLVRGPRLAGKMGHQLAREVLEAMHEMRGELRHLPAERFQAELEKASKYAGWSSMLRALSDTGVLEVYLPEWADTDIDQRNPHHHASVRGHILDVCEAADRAGARGTAIMMACLLHDIGKPATMRVNDQGRGTFYGHELVGAEMAGAILPRLKFDSDTTRRVVGMVRLHMSLRSDISTRKLRRMANELGSDLETFLQLTLADRQAHVDGVDERYLQKFEKLRQAALSLPSQGAGPFDERQLALNGQALMAMGVSHGKALGRIKKALAQRVIDGELPNEVSALQQAAQAMI